MIKNIVFDLGGVLVDFHPVDCMKKLGFSNEAIKAFNENIFSGLWESCDKHRMDDKTIRKLFKDNVLGFEKEVDTLWDNLTEITSVYDYSYRWLKSLKDAGFRIYILSNFGEMAFKINSKLYDFLELADGKVISYEIDEVKPSPVIYKALCDKYSLVAEECVFIDDRPVNIEGAKKFAMEGIVFRSYNETKEELMNLLKS